VPQFSLPESTQALEFRVANRTLRKGCGPLIVSYLTESEISSTRSENVSPWLQMAPPLQPDRWCDGPVPVFNGDLL